MGGGTDENLHRDISHSNRREQLTWKRIQGPNRSLNEQQKELGAVSNWRATARCLCSFCQVKLESLVVRGGKFGRQRGTPHQGFAVSAGGMCMCGVPALEPATTKVLATPRHREPAVAWTHKIFPLLLVPAFADEDGLLVSFGYPLVAVARWVPLILLVDPHFPLLSVLLRYLLVAVSGFAEEPGDDSVISKRRHCCSPLSTYERYTLNKNTLSS